MFLQWAVSELLQEKLFFNVWCWPMLAAKIIDIMNSMFHPNCSVRNIDQAQCSEPLRQCRGSIYVTFYQLFQPDRSSPIHTSLSKQAPFHYFYKWLGVIHSQSALYLVSTVNLYKECNYYSHAVLYTVQFSKIIMYNYSHYNFVAIVIHH